MWPNARGLHPFFDLGRVLEFGRLLAVVCGQVWATVCRHVGSGGMGASLDTTQSWPTQSITVMMPQLKETLIAK